MLPHDDLGQIRGGERLPFLRQRAVHQQLRKRLFLSGLIEPAAQGPELLHAGTVLFATEEKHGFRIRRPARLATASEQGLRRNCPAKSKAAERGSRRNSACWLGRRFQHRLANFDARCRLRHCPFLFCFLQGFMNSAHSFPSLVVSCSCSFSFSARFDSVFRASIKSNFSGEGVGGRGRDVRLSPRSKSRATASTMPVVTSFCWSTKALTKQCSQIKFTTRGMPLE